PCPVLAHKRHPDTGFGVRRLVEMIGHLGGGTVTVDLHLGDVVDESLPTFGHRISLPGKNISLSSLLVAAGVSAEVGVVLPLQRVVLTHRGAADLLVHGWIVADEDVEQPDSDHSEYNE